MNNDKELISHLKKENERLLSIACAANNMLAELSPFDWSFIFSAPMNGGEGNVKKINDAMKYLSDTLNRKPI